MSKSLKKLIDINRLREFKDKLVGTDSAYVQTTAIDQTIAGTKTFSKPIVGSVTGSSGSCTGNAATATKATQDSDGNQINTTYSKNGHTHDDRYYTEAEVNNLLNGKANTSGTYNSFNAGNGVDSYGGSWIRFKNGLQICFGIATAGQNNSFPKAFKSGTIPHVNLTHYTSNNWPYSATVQQGSAGSITNVTFDFLLWNLKDNTYVGYDCHYIAIGFWK